MSPTNTVTPFCAAATAKPVAAVVLPVPPFCPANDTTHPMIEPPLIAWVRRVLMFDGVLVLALRQHHQLAVKIQRQRLDVDVEPVPHVMPPGDTDPRPHRLATLIPLTHRVNAHHLLV